MPNPLTAQSLHWRKSLLNRIERRYPIMERTIALTSRQINITIVEDADKLLEHLSTEDADGTLHLPYWTYLWPASIGLARYLDQMSRLTGHQILEIGCGFGLAGVVGCQQGGRVFFTDYKSDALMFAQYNVLQNGCADRASFVQMDWNTPCLKRRFSRVLASDVIYEEKNWQPILALIERYLTVDGEAIFSEPNRANALGFLELIGRYGFTYETHTDVVCLDGGSATIAVYCVRRASR
ncbi:MAG: methyltransferase domain-containing protein [Candidatus Poribacteria bacterium]|nr:methyltransferase domain-containing protein [Candidatus Poribacteria bacterium]